MKASRSAFVLSPLSLAPLVLAPLVLAGCDSDPQTCVPGMSVACVGAGGCAGFQVCDSEGAGFGACMCGMDAGRPPGDSGLTDGGALTDAGDVSEAGVFDAGPVVDAGPGVDGGGVDGGRMDGGGPDAGRPDAGRPDAGRPDAGRPDAGAPDAGPGCGACGITQRCCGSCVNLSVPVGSNGRSDSSFNHCNGCGLACNVDRASACSAPSGSGTPRCMCGFTAACAPGEVCVADAGGYRCADLATDRDNCGAIGNVCPAGETCAAGLCRCGTGATCGAGSACCGGACTATGSDPNNCGGCGVVCGPHAPNCAGGVCGCGAGPACAPPIPDVFGGSLGETCCAGTCRANSDTSCACGTACTSPDVCVVDTGILGPPASGGVCCGTPTPIGGFCSAP